MRIEYLKNGWCKVWNADEASVEILKEEQKSDPEAVKEEDGFWYYEYNKYGERLTRRLLRA